MRDIQIFESKVLEELCRSLGELPLIHVLTPPLEVREADSHGDELRTDSKIRLEHAAGNVTLLVKLRKTVYPRDARQILHQLNQLGGGGFVNDQSESVVAVLAAESISSGAKELLRSGMVGYFDMGGSLFISTAGVYIYVDKPVPKAIQKTIRTLFRGKRAQVLQALLHGRETWFSVKTLAEIAGVSCATASETLTQMEQFDWLNIRGKGPTKERQLARPAELLSEWANKVSNEKPVEVRRYFVPSGGSASITERLATICETNHAEYVVTQEFAAQMYSPYLSAEPMVTCRMALNRAAQKTLSELGAREVREGANFVIIETETTGEFMNKELLGHVWLANPIQVYLDLMRGHGRSSEMALHLRREKIGF